MFSVALARKRLVGESQVGFEPGNPVVGQHQRYNVVSVLLNSTIAK